MTHTGIKGLIRVFKVDEGDKLTRFEAPFVPGVSLSLDNGVSLEDLDILNGNGEDFFEGILRRPCLTKYDPNVVLSRSSTVTCRDVLTLMTQVRRIGVNPWASQLAMNSKTASVLMDFKKQDGVPIWDSSDKSNLRLIGIPLVIDEGLPDVAPGAKPIWVGQFDKALFILEGPKGSAAVWYHPQYIVALQIPEEIQEGLKE